MSLDTATASGTTAVYKHSCATETHSYCHYQPAPVCHSKDFSTQTGGLHTVS